MAKRIAHLEYSFVIRQDAQKNRYEEHIVTLRYVGETITTRQRFETYEAAKTFIHFTQERANVR